MSETQRVRRVLAKAAHRGKTPRTRDRSAWSEEQRRAYLAGIVIALRVLQGRKMRLRMRLKRGYNRYAELMWERLDNRCFALLNRLLAVATPDEEQVWGATWLSTWLDCDEHPGTQWWEDFVAPRPLTP